MERVASIARPEAARLRSLRWTAASVTALAESATPDDVQRSYVMHANAYVGKPADLDGFDDVAKRIDACFLGLIELPPG